LPILQERKEWSKGQAMTAASVTGNTASTIPFYAKGRRSRDLAQEMGISEAELLAAHQGPEVVRLAAAMRDLIEALPALGEVMSLTRNEGAVHEKVGSFGNIRISGGIGLVLNDAIDLRMFLKHWVSAFAVEIPDEKGPRRSLQVFDAGGEAVIKVHLKTQSDVAAFEAIRSRFADPAPLPLQVVPAQPEPLPAQAFDAEGFRKAFAEMQDVHEFHPLLTKFGTDRHTALGVLDADHVRLLPNTATRTLLEQSAAGGLPIMCFVGNKGCIQIHHGAVRTVKVMGPWVNVLDPGFNLHLREDLVAETWAVRKPTKHGLVTSVELYAADRSLIAQFFGVRDEQAPEDGNWRALVASL
jgi:putative hemin transport protein